MTSLRGSGIRRHTNRAHADKLMSVALGAGGSKTYGYDAAGRTTSVTTAGGTTNLTYDYEDRVKSITYPGGATNTFAYNGLDTRTQKVDSSGTKNYRRDGVGVTDPVLSDGVSTFTPGTSIRTGSTSTYTTSGLKNATGQTNASAALIATRTYDAFGNQTANTGTWSGPFGYAGDFGYQEDADSGLKLLGHRYYDPSTGRFLTRDPAGHGRNWYVYCYNNPVAGADPDGLARILIVTIEPNEYWDNKLRNKIADQYADYHDTITYIDGSVGKQALLDAISKADDVYIIAHGSLNGIDIGNEELYGDELVRYLKGHHIRLRRIGLYVCLFITDGTDKNGSYTGNLRGLKQVARHGFGFKDDQKKGFMGEDGPGYCHCGRETNGVETPSVKW
ncbi:MAG: RHS repeat-associated core domain-containing protein [Armatimonadetes bacterium]|nr:RHS repeat-associated core domain-containing protein [Armatimonadota bacterium]